MFEDQNIIRVYQNEFKIEINIKLSEMIHGQKKAKKQKSIQQTKEQEVQSQKIHEKLKEFFILRNRQVKEDQIDKLLQFTSILMQLCSDIPTVFNFRREILQYMMNRQVAETEKVKVLSNDLKLNTKIIMQDTKSYTLWSHRQWVIQKLFTFDPSITDKEKQLIKKLLQKDEKNFHAWNYRSWVNSISMNIETQLEFTHQKIKQNPFNFSPYHFRSRYLTIKYSQQLNPEIILYGMPKNILEQEIESVQTAIFLNPSEEAPWNYYNWIIQQLTPTLLLQNIPITQTSTKLIFSMNITSPYALVQPQTAKIDLETSSKNGYSDTWILSTQQKWTLDSTLHLQSLNMSFQSSGKFLIGQNKNPQALKQIRDILDKQLNFVGQVIESQDNQCRMGYLQVIEICKTLMMCGCNPKSWKNITQKAINAFMKLENEKKNQKYIAKLYEHWKKLANDGDQNLTVQSLGLKYYDI